MTPHTPPVVGCVDVVIETPILVVGGTADPLEQAAVVRATMLTAAVMTRRWMRMTNMLPRSRRR